MVWLKCAIFGLKSPIMPACIVLYCVAGNEICYDKFLILMNYVGVLSGWCEHCANHIGSSEDVQM